MRDRDIVGGDMGVVKINDGDKVVAIDARNLENLVTSERQLPRPPYCLYIKLLHVVHISFV